MLGIRSRGNDMMLVGKSYVSGYRYAYGVMYEMCISKPVGSRSNMAFSVGSVLNSFKHTDNISTISFKRV